MERRRPDDEKTRLSVRWFLIFYRIVGSPADGLFGSQISTTHVQASRKWPLASPIRSVWPVLPRDGRC